jgi:hypothetical protein
MRMPDELPGHFTASFRFARTNGGNRVSINRSQVISHNERIAF